MQLHYTERFLRTAKKLSPDILNDLTRCVAHLEHPSEREPLHVYPLEGRLRGLSSITINFAYQAIAVSNEAGVIFLDIAPRA